jgi:hypothetical protein
MRVWILITLAAVLAIPSYAARRITVEELQQTLVSFEATRQADESIARQLSTMELIERLSSARLERLKDGLPGVKSRTALLALADSSVFLDPPAAEIISAPAPGSVTLYKMLVPVANYVNATLHQLPNFFTTRDITSFENQPPRLASRSTSIVTYRNGQEVVEKADAKSKSNQPRTQGLVTHGVFGPILSTVLRDALTGSIRWGRWEEGANGAVAVILYAVPLEKSHYSVWSACNGASCVSTMVNGLMSTAAETSNPAAYHGEVAFDPASGAILRIAIVADMLPKDSIVRDDIFVEYGTVEIGGKSYICPVRSISLVVERAAVSGRGIEMPQRLLNDVVYRQYHRFGSEVRMLPPDTPEPADNP